MISRMHPSKAFKITVSTNFLITSIYMTFLFTPLRFTSFLASNSSWQLSKLSQVAIYVCSHAYVLIKGIDISHVWDPSEHIQVSKLRNFDHFYYWPLMNEHSWINVWYIYILIIKINIKKKKRKSRSICKEGEVVTFLSFAFFYG